MSEKVEDCARLQAENDVLRGLVQRNPDWRCTYGLDIDHMVKCPHGFPGCACADDLMAGDDAEWKAMAKERLAFRAERDAALAEVQRLREVAERVKAAWRAFYDAPIMQDDEEFDALLRAMYHLARSLVEPAP